MDKRVFAITFVVTTAILILTNAVPRFAFWLLK